ncbi:hypothetical protein C0J52_04314 [Blattella germanica]|nr:hypothetical protein C0J52_04314 [Blattella germanica]
MSDFNFSYANNFIYKPKREMSSLLINKTPISLLQEWLSHLGKKPNYELLQEGIGGNNCNTHFFCFRVSVGEVSAIGYGRSKKEAKHAAARSLLNMSPETEFYNPVGKLQEICTARHWAHPIYMLVSEQGPPHDRLFAISVEVQTIKLELEDPNDLQNVADINVVTQQSSKKVLANGISTSYAQMLQEVAAQQKFEIYYENIEDKAPGGLFQCMIRITTWPIIYCKFDLSDGCSFIKILLRGFIKKHFMDHVCSIDNISVAEYVINDIYKSFLKHVV